MGDMAEAPQGLREARLRLPIATIAGNAKGLADGLEGHLTHGYDIGLKGLLEGLRYIERTALAALGEASEPGREG